MRKRLEWAETEYGAWEATTSTPSGTRVYTLNPPYDVNAWMVVLSPDREPRITVVRGWARTLDEAKQVADEWERAFCRRQTPPV
jgi:hypothetical protein